MHIQELTLANVRQFEQRTLSFQPRFNLFVGKNGAGKTTLLRAILAVLGSAKQTGRRPALLDDDIRLRTRDLHLEAKIDRGNLLPIETRTYNKHLGERARRTRVGDDPLVLLYASNEAACSSFVSRKVRQSTSNWRGDTKEAEEFFYEAELGISTEIAPEFRFGRSQEIRPFLSKALSTFSKNFEHFAWRLVPYDCTVRQPQDSKRQPDYSVERRALGGLIMRHLAETRNAYRWPDQTRVLVNARGTIVGGKRSEPAIPPFRELLRELRPDKPFVSDVEEWTAEIRLTPRILMNTPQGQLFLHQLSDGEQRLFSLFADIARQLSVQASSLRIHAMPAIVLIDEIDVHLHPDWQRKIVRALERLFPVCQFIATTHSPFVIQGVREDEVQRLGGPILGKFADKGIEEIAVKVMGIEDHQVSRRYLDMLDTAKEYFRLLETAHGIRQKGLLAELRQKLHNLSHQYAENPAYQAYLEMHGNLTLGPDELR